MSSGGYSKGFLGSKGPRHYKSKKLCKPSSSSDANPTSADNTAGAQPEFIVEKITGKRYENGKVQMEVKWKNFPSERSTWEPLENLANCMVLLAEFEAELFRQQERSGSKKKGGKANRPMGPKSNGTNNATVSTPKPTTFHKIGESHKENVPPSLAVPKTPIKLHPAMHLQFSDSSGDERPSCSFGKRASSTPADVWPSSSDEEMGDLEISSDSCSRLSTMSRPRLSSESSMSSGSDSLPLSKLPTSSANTELTSLSSLKEQARQWQAGKSESKFGALLKTLTPTKTLAKEMAAQSISASPGKPVEEAMKSIHSMQLAKKHPEVQTSGGNYSKKDNKKSSKKSTMKNPENGQKKECSDEDLDSPLTPQTPRGRSSSSNWKMTPCTTPFGLARGLELDKVVHNFQVRDRLFLFVTWKGLDAVDAVHMEELKVAYPAQVIEYFEKMERRYK